MSRFAPLLIMFAFAGCDDGKAKVEKAVDKAGQAVDKLENDEAQAHLAAAQQAFTAGKEAPEACSWAKSATADELAQRRRPDVVELRRLCAFETPLLRATTALKAAETARAEQPQAPTLTECQSETWSQAAAVLDREHADSTRWAELKARWVKACP